MRGKSHSDSARMPVHGGVTTMPSAAGEKTEETQAALCPQSLLSQPPQPSTLRPMTIHVYPAQQPPMKSKRHQVKNACTSCKKDCKKCDDARPCFRCVKYGIADNCVDSQRKRRRSVKRGPYKRKGNNVQQGEVQPEQPVQLTSAPSAIQPPHTEPWNVPGSCPPYGYPQGFYMYNHYPPVASQQAEGVHVCMPVAQPHYLAPAPQFQPYVYPDHGAKYHIPPSENCYTAVFSSISYPEDGHLVDGSGAIARDQP